MKILADLNRNAWNSFVSSFPEPAILQSYEWGELKACHGWEPIRLAVEDNGKIVAAILILKRKLPYLNFSFFYAPRGPVMDFNNIKAFDFLLEAIGIEAKRHNAISLKIDPQIDESSADMALLLKKKGFIQVKKSVQPRATFIVDLTSPEEELLASFEEKTRYNIRLAFKKGVIVKDVSSAEGVKIFYELYKETAKRDNFLVHPVNYYYDIKRCLVDNKLANIFVAYHEDKPIAAVYIFCFSSRVWYMYGASSSEARNLMPNHALHWHVIKWARENGSKSYDLFGIPSNPNPDHPLWGVYRFKKGFNGKLVKYIGVFDLPYRPLLYYFLESGIKFYQNARSLIKKGKVSDSLSE